MIDMEKIKMALDQIGIESGLYPDQVLKQTAAILYLFEGWATNRNVATKGSDAVAIVSGSGERPYLFLIETRPIRCYNPKYGDDKKCNQCGHDYRRHFDSYDDMADIGCKYCSCDTFTEASH